MPPVFLYYAPDFVLTTYVIYICMLMWYTGGVQDKVNNVARLAAVGLSICWYATNIKYPAPYRVPHPSIFKDVTD